MKRFLTSALIVLSSCLILMPQAEAQSRPGRGGSGGNRTEHSSRPGNSGGNSNHSRHGNNRGNRPGYGQGFRPDHGNGNNHGVRPGYGQGFRPGKVQRYRPALRPGVPRPRIMPRPYRPSMPPVRPFYRPVPPRTWRPAYRPSLLSSILGITTGIVITNAIDHLLYNGYVVDGYTSDEIYLTNVPMFGYSWPTATMYYNSGQLAGSRFYYSTIGYDKTRYLSTYSELCNLYGAPIGVTDTAEGVCYTWYGNGNQFITLDFGPSMTDSGRRYFTTLSIGL